jgi:hypothetical protein
MAHWVTSDSVARTNGRERYDGKKIVGSEDRPRVDTPRHQFGANGAVGAGHGRARGVVGRPDARRGRVGSGVAGEPNGATLGASGITGRRRWRARSHVQALGLTPDRRQLAPCAPRSG